MGFLRRLLGGGRVPADVGMVAAWRLAPERQDAVLQVVGEQSYQPDLRSLGGRLTPSGPTNTEFVAALIAEPDNKHDKNAVSVRIAGRVVGYLAREDAIRYAPILAWAAGRGRVLAADARLTGGWTRGTPIADRLESSYTSDRPAKRCSNCWRGHLPYAGIMRGPGS